MATLTRFAPAPTGWLHLGHVRNALAVWETARRVNARVLLRIEDHDRIRSQPEYEAGILDDLDWLEFKPDVFPTRAFRAGPCPGRQSDRGHVYGNALQLLIARGLVYACDCSRAQIAADAGEPPTGTEARYAGRCRDRKLPFMAGLGLRVRMDPGVETFEDLRLGKQEQDPSAQCGDLLVRDRDGHWTYQFAAAVDDWRQGIDLVVRGEDLLSSTGRQMRLARLLGRVHPPSFLHHALIMKTPRQKLSKSNGDSGIRNLRARGWTPQQVIAAARG